MTDSDTAQAPEKEEKKTRVSNKKLEDQVQALANQVAKLTKAVSAISHMTGNNKALLNAGFTKEELYKLTKQDLSK